MSLKFAITFLVIFFMIADGDQLNLSIEIDDKDAGLCSEKAELIWQFAWRYFKDMHAVEIFGYQDGSSDFSNEILKCGMRNPELSVQYNISIWDIASGPEKRSLIEGDIYYRHTMNGLIYIKETAEDIMTIFPPIDQETKVIIILTNASADDASDILRSAWRQYHILDLIIFYTSGTIMMQKGVLDLAVSLCDPFIIKNNTRGVVQTFLVTNDDWLTNKLLIIMSARLINVYGYPLRVLTQDNWLYQTDECDGPNCEITHAIVETSSFEPEYYEAIAEKDWFEVEHGRADMMARVASIGQSHQRHSIFLYPITSEGFHFIVPKMQRGYTVSFVKIFNPVVSLMLALSYAVMVLTWRWLQKKNQELLKNGDKMVDLMKVCYTLLGNLLQVSQPGSGERRYERCLFFSWIIFSMLVCFHYQATMVQHLAAGGPSRDINTIEGLAESDLKILLIESDSLRLEALATDMEAPQYYRQLLKHTQIVSLSDWIHNVPRRVGMDRDVATMYNLDSCKYLEMALYTRKTGEDAIHILQEELFSTYNSLLVPLDSPYKDRFNEILMKILESGLMQKWERTHHNSLEREFLMSRVYNPEPRNDVYRMEDLYYIFWSWFGCCCFCCLVFLGEIFWFRLVVIKRKQKQAKARRQNVRDYVNEICHTVDQNRIDNIRRKRHQAVQIIEANRNGKR